MPLYCSVQTSIYRRYLKGFLNNYKPLIFPFLRRIIKMAKGRKKKCDVEAVEPQPVDSAEESAE